MAEKIAGLDGVLSRLQTLEGKEARKIVRHSLREASKPLRNDMKRRAKRFDDPATPERLYRQIKTRTIKKRTLKRFSFDEGVATGVINDPQYFYAKFLEFGTRYMQAQPFIRPAADAERAEMLRIVVDDLWNGISTQMRK